jgi:hypothetical protein
MLISALSDQGIGAMVGKSSAELVRMDRSHLPIRKHNDLRCARLAAVQALKGVR